MSVRVKLATTPAEIRRLLEVRHRVFVEEDGYMSAQGGTIVDLYDALPTSANLIAVVDGEVSGGMRITLDSEAGMPADSFYDFRKLLPIGARAASMGMLCLRRSNRRSSRILPGIMHMIIYWASTHGRTHLCAPVNPKVVGIAERVGFVAVDDEFVDAKGLPSVPMMLDIANLQPEYVDFIQRQDVGLWMDSFERAFFDTHEPIITGGQAGTEAFLLVDGAAAALKPGEATDGEIVQRFQPGQVFGELALLTDRPRSTTVIATEPTDVMVLNREQFERQVAENPDLALTLMRSLGERFHDAIVHQSLSHPGNA